MKTIIESFRLAVQHAIETGQKSIYIDAAVLDVIFRNMKLEYCLHDVVVGEWCDWCNNGPQPEIIYDNKFSNFRIVLGTSDEE